ncbi:MAG: hydroxyacid dehydrogenase [Acidobacteriota bacterium]
MKIVIAEPISAVAIEMLKAQPGWDVVISNPKEFAQHLPDAVALFVRSGVKVSAAVLAQAPKLKAVGRVGVGVDNLDLPALAAAGVVAMNTPGGNAVAVAELTLGFMLSMARSIPQASASTKSGKWEKKIFQGSELRGKTLGIVGLGAIGREVAKRAAAFAMTLVAYDPFVSPEVAEKLGVKLVELSTLYTASDYITLHLGVTPETHGMLNDAAFAQMKKGVRIVNCARGELIDAAALVRAIESGKVSGAALDVFETEPPAAGDALLASDAVFATPHIGGATGEAQEMVGIQIAEQVRDFLTTGVARNAVKT